jgi:hypothetical protein
VTQASSRPPEGTPGRKPGTRQRVLWSASLPVAQLHNFSDRIDGSERPARPRMLARVLQRIDDDPAQAYTMSDLAAIAG